MNLQYRNYTRKFESDNEKQQKKYNIIFNGNYEKTTYSIVGRIGNAHPSIAKKKRMTEIILFLSG